MSESPQQLAARYAEEFKSQYKNIESLIYLSADTTSAVSNISDLQLSLTDATAFLPAYVQRSYDNQIKALEAKLAATGSVNGTLRKFSFRKKLDTSGRPNSSIEAGFSRPGHFALKRPAAGPSIGASAPEPVTRVKPHAISSHSSTHLTHLNVSPIPLLDGTAFSAASLRDLVLSELADCTVDLRALSSLLVAVQIRKLARVSLMIGWIEGSVFIENWKEGRGLFGARQMRMHESEHLIMHLFATSMPVIEHSKDIAFAPYPAMLSKLLPEEYDLSTSLHGKVQDFDFPAEASPNWRLATRDEVERGEEWVACIDNANSTTNGQATL